MATYDLNDDGVVVIVGSGAGGGTLANELCQKGIAVVLLEAGKKENNDTFVNDEWESFAQLAWLDKRTTSGSWRIARDFPNLPAWICKTVGGSTTHWAGASLRFQEDEFRIRSVYSDIQDANLLDWPITLEDLEPYYARAEDKMGVTRTNGIRGLPGNNNFKVLYTGPSGSATRRSIPAAWRSTASRATTGRAVSRLASASKAARARRSGARSIRRSRQPLRLASWNSGPRVKSSRSSTTWPARSLACSTPPRTGSSTSRKRGWSALPATQSRAPGCC